MLYEKMEFPEALRTLAGKFGVALPAAGTPLDDERRRILAINKQAASYFRAELQGPRGEAARTYLAGRGLAAATVEKFGIGYAPEGWGNLKSHLGKARIGEAEAVQAGVLARKEETGRAYDRFRDRVMFPIVDLAGDVLGFGGRVLGQGEPKYLNSPETAAFHKGDTLYAVGAAREAVRNEGFAVLVEGYMDVIALHQAGVTQVVATLGTGFTSGHVRLLKRYTDRVVVNFDPDAAGRAAARRSLEVLLENGFEVSVVSLPPGKDPDLFVREEGPERYKERLQAAAPYIEYLAREAAARRDIASPRGKVEALNEILPILARLDHPVRRAGYVEMIATVLGIEDGLVLQELREAVRGRKSHVAKAAPAAPGLGVSEAEGGLVRALLDGPESRGAVLPGIESHDLEGSRIAEIVDAVRGLMVAGGDVTYPRVAALVGDAARGVLTRIAAESRPVATAGEARGCLFALRAAQIQRQMTQIQKRLETRGGGMEVDDLLRRKVELKRKMEALREAGAQF
jgi:DNA primase